MARLSQEPEPDRDNKRRKVDNSSKNSKHEERKAPPPLPPIDFPLEKDGKRDRSVKPKEKKEKTEEEKELKKERKLGRKRDRIDEALQLEMKRRREEDKGRRDDDKVFKLMSPNGEMIEPPIHSSREKHHRSREISPYQRDRSHEKSEPRDKHRRSSENKRR
ncbi:hypothetical protein JTB14_035692 [Gonioctena quinquepunctata]|nr:hypothetical protein JTB14_035692 [Gonioctena quinquepunctata]